MENLKTNLSKHHFPDSLIKKGFQKALSIPQKDLRKPKKPSKENILPFITTFNTNNPNIYSTIKSSVNSLKNNDVSGLHNIKLIQSKRQSPNLKKLLTKAEFGEVSSGTFNCSNKRCESLDQITSNYVQITFKLKNRFPCNSFNLIYVVICCTLRRNILERQGKKKLNQGTESECIANTFSNHNTNN